MKLTVVRSGGLAGMSRTWEADIPDRQAERWLPLLQHDVGPPASAAPAPDTFSYRITLGELATERDEATLTPEWQELIDLARNQP